MLADPVVLGVSGVLFAVEFLADKIPVVDSVWDAVHTFIRRSAAPWRAVRWANCRRLPRCWRSSCLAGTATHAAKATTRLA